MLMLNVVNGEKEEDDATRVRSVITTERDK